MKRRDASLLLATALLALVMSAGFTLRPRAAPPATLVGRHLPEFTLPWLSDEGAAGALLPAELHGRVWVLNVWASWCAPCRDEHALLLQLAREQRVVLVGLNHKDDPQAAREWLLKLGDPYLATALDREGQVGTGLGLSAVPASFVIDSAGIVRLRHLGPLTPRVWAEQVQPLIRALDPTPRR